MQEIIRGLECCLAFKKKINYRHEEPFESEYEVGTLTEEGHLVLQTSGQDYSDARWVGEWIYKFKGKEGTGEGVSQATMTYHKGEKSAELVVSASHVSSAGRMNFPMALAGSKKDVTIEGEPMDPQASFFSKSDSIPLTGCHENLTRIFNIFIFKSLAASRLGSPRDPRAPATRPGRFSGSQ